MGFRFFLHFRQGKALACNRIVLVIAVPALLVISANPLRRKCSCKGTCRTNLQACGGLGFLERSGMLRVSGSGLKVSGLFYWTYIGFRV